MFTLNSLKIGALSLMLATTVAGAAWAQTQSPPQGYSRVGSCAGGLFTLSGGTAKFHVALDDDSSQPSVFVLMRFINSNGTVVRVRTAMIAPGGSATLDYSGSGLYRMQAERYEPSISLSDRRSVVTSWELFGLDGGRLIPPGPWSACQFLNTQQ
jgi:hypothetical protein